MLIPQKFPIEILEKALHYTDSEKNPAFEAFQGSNFWEFQTGAKGVSKSFNGAIITIFRIVNDKRFNSIWCRNRYKHIKLTLVPTFKKALDFLAESFNLDYRNFFKFYDEKIFWTFEDGGEGRGIYFANWENIQSFQGLTLPKTTFLWGELVIDEPVEDPKDADLNSLKKTLCSPRRKLAFDFAKHSFAAKCTWRLQSKSEIFLQHIYIGPLFSSKFSFKDYSFC